MEEWNTDDFQGRSKDRLERNYKIIAILIVFGWLIGTGIVLYKIIDYIF